MLALGGDAGGAPARRLRRLAERQRPAEEERRPPSPSCAPRSRPRCPTTCCPPAWCCCDRAAADRQRQGRPPGAGRAGRPGGRSPGAASSRHARRWSATWPALRRSLEGSEPWAATTTSSPSAATPSPAPCSSTGCRRSSGRSSTWWRSSTPPPWPASPPTSPREHREAVARRWGPESLGDAAVPRLPQVAARGGAARASARAELAELAGSLAAGPGRRRRRRRATRRRSSCSRRRARAPPCCASCSAATRACSRRPSWSCSASPPWPSASAAFSGTATASGWRGRSAPSWKRAGCGARAGARHPAREGEREGLATHALLRPASGAGSASASWSTRPPPTPSTPGAGARRGELRGALLHPPGPPPARHDPLLRGGQARPDLLPPAASVLAAASWPSWSGWPASATSSSSSPACRRRASTGCASRTWSPTPSGCCAALRLPGAPLRARHGAPLRGSPPAA